MDWLQLISLVLNLIFGGGFLVTLVTLRSERKKADAQAKASELDNVEHASEILMDNIVKPLKKELNEIRQQVTRLRKAIDAARSCRYISTCPVHDSLQKSESRRRGADNGGKDSRDGAEDDSDA